MLRQHASGETLHVVWLRSVLCSEAQESLCCVRSTGTSKRQVTRMMPIGVPRVPYRTPKEGGWQWVDIWNCLVNTEPRRPFTANDMAVQKLLG